MPDQENQVHSVEWAEFLVWAQATSIMHNDSLWIYLTHYHALWTHLKCVIPCGYVWVKTQHSKKSAKRGTGSQGLWILINTKTFPYLNLERIIKAPWNNDKICKKNVGFIGPLKRWDNRNFIIYQIAPGPRVSGKITRGLQDIFLLLLLFIKHILLDK